MSVGPSCECCGERVYANGCQRCDYRRVYCSCGFMVRCGCGVEYQHTCRARRVDSDPYSWFGAFRWGESASLVSTGGNRHMLDRMVPVRDKFTALERFGVCVFMAEVAFIALAMVFFVGRVTGAAPCYRPHEVHDSVPNQPDAVPVSYGTPDLPVSAVTTGCPDGRLWCSDDVEETVVVTARSGRRVDVTMGPVRTRSAAAFRPVTLEIGDSLTMWSGMSSDLVSWSVGHSVPRFLP